MNFIFIWNIQTIECLFKLLSHIIVCLNRIIGEAIWIAVKQLEKVTKNLSAITSIDFFNHKELFLGFIIRICIEFPCLDISLEECLFYEFINYALFCYGFAIIILDYMTSHITHLHRFSCRFITSYKCRIVTIRMKSCTNHTFTTNSFVDDMRLTCSWCAIIDLLKIGYFLAFWMFWRCLSTNHSYITKYHFG